MSCQGERALLMPVVWQSGRTGLIQAANTGQTETVSLLLERGANVDAADEVFCVCVCVCVRARVC